MAKTKNGKMFCLGDSYTKDTLLRLRNWEEFFCPVCGEKVILKLGDQKIYHFSHLKGGNCRDFYENETEYHMEGKLKLYQWLRKQDVPAILEYYDREIQQRPDILFKYNGQKYALEFQCSTISEALFKQRTKNYMNHSYTPFWILGGKNLKEKYQGSASLTGFQYLFLRESIDGKLYIPSFSPDKNVFNILHSIFPYSNKNVLHRKITVSIQKARLDSLLEPPLEAKVNIDQWEKANERYKVNWSIYPSEQQKFFFTEVYTNRLNLFLLPPEIGLPVSHGLLLQTPPFIWQTYYYIDVLHHLNSGDLISSQQITRCFQKRVCQKAIVPRNFPLIQNMNPLLAYVEYTRLLERLDVLIRITDQLFQIQKPFIIPQTNREKEERILQFFKENPRILEKNK